MSYQPISQSEAHKLMESLPAYMFLDVREEEEFISGHAEGSLNFPLDSISEETASSLIPDMDYPIFVYCKSGKRSAHAALILSSFGYKVYDIGSLVGWNYGIEFGI